ncbi:MAG TPA: hypothetical protein DD473_04290 [Planctomycetaceae bacterium]|nr:hypothetical protein [Planctomycetaceae bacterium]
MHLHVNDCQSIEGSNHLQSPRPSLRSGSCHPQLSTHSRLAIPRLTPYGFHLRNLSTHKSTKDSSMLPRPEADSAVLLLIRHGATEANLRRPYILQGRTLNGPLSETGVEQVTKARDFLKDFPIDACYASPMVRARQSAEIIAEPHGHEVQSLEEII